MQLFESQITGIVGGHINNYLQVGKHVQAPLRSLKACARQQYAANPAENWKSKDTAIYLLTSIASRGSTQHVSFPMEPLLPELTEKTISARCHFRQRPRQRRGILHQQRVCRFASRTIISTPYSASRRYQVSLHFQKSGTHFCLDPAKPYLTRDFIAHQRSTGLSLAVTGSTSGVHQLCRLLIRCHHH